MGNKGKFASLAGLSLFVLVATQFYLRSQEQNQTSPFLEEVESSHEQEDVEDLQTSLAPDSSASGGRGPASTPGLRRNWKGKLPPAVRRSLGRRPASTELRTLPMALEDKHWKVWDGVKASPEHSFQRLPDTEIVGRVSGYVLVKANLQNSVERFSTESPLAVFNERLAVPGVVTGTLSLKLKHKDELPDVLQDYGLKTRDSFPEISVYYVTAQKNPFNLAQLFQALQQDPRIERVEPEIVNRKYEKR